jgi:anion-transporting  ArsA/GET3 family ATPase
MVIPEAQATTPFAQARLAMQQQYLVEMAARFPVPVVQIPLLPGEVQGLDVLSELGQQVLGERIAA